MAHPVVHFEVLGKNPQALHSFYHAAFDWELSEPLPQLNSYAMVAPSEGRGIGGGIGGGMDDYAGHVTFYVEVGNLEIALERIAVLGGRTVVPPGSIPSAARIAMFADCEGHIVGLVEAGTTGGGTNDEPN